MRVVFMGTPDFAVPCLDALLRAGHQVVAVVTQPDRPKGRGQQPAFSPVKQAALAGGIEVLQPQRVKEDWFIRKLHQLRPEVIAVVAFGQILPGEILDLPPLGCINVHASLLPKYRGAAPIHWSVINGEETTGVTTMRMDKGMDTGDMLLKAETPIGQEDTVGAVHDRLAQLGSSLLLETLEGLARGSLTPIPQDPAEATYAPMLRREDELIRWDQDAHSIVNLIRGMNPWPGAYTVQKGKNLKIWRATCQGPDTKAAPGSIISVEKNLGFLVQSGRGAVLVEEVQPPGGKKMGAAAFARGYGVIPGEQLG